MSRLNELLNYRFLTYEEFRELIELKEIRHDQDNGESWIYRGKRWFTVTTVSGKKYDVYVKMGE